MSPLSVKYGNSLFFWKWRQSSSSNMRGSKNTRKKTTLQLSILYEFLYIYKIIVICNAFKFFVSLFFIFKYTYKQNYEIDTRTHTLYPMFLVSECTCICMNFSADTWKCDVYLSVCRCVHFCFLCTFMCVCSSQHTKPHQVYLHHFYCHVT